MNFEDLKEHKYFKYFIANCVLSICLIEWALSKLKPLRPVTNE